MARRHFFWAWTFLALAVMAIYPALTRPIEVLAYDAALEHVPRSLVFSQAIADGALYPRWVQALNWGLGSPLFTFQPPLPYYAIDALFRLGVPHTLGWRIIIAAGLLLAGLGAYALVLLLTKNRWAALAAGIAYLYAPYVIRNAMERGSNETFAMFLYPWVFWGLLRLAQRPSAARFVVATALWAACIACHVLAPLIVLPFAGVLALLSAWHYRSAQPLLALLAGALLTAFIWLPMLTEQSWVHAARDFTQADAIPLQNPLSLGDLLAPPAIYDVQSGSNGTGVRMGLLYFLPLLIAAPAAAWAWWSRRPFLAACLACAAACGLLLVWLLTPASNLAWQLGSWVLARVQYRTRLMGLEALAAACAWGFLLALPARRWAQVLSLGIVALLIAAAIPALYVELEPRNAPYGLDPGLADVRRVETQNGLYGLTAFGEFTPRWQSKDQQERLAYDIGPALDAAVAPLRNAGTGVQVKTSRVASSAWDLNLELSHPASVTLSLLYYPRWQALLDGKPTALQPEASTGYAAVDIPVAGSHHLALRYGSTSAERAGMIISGLMALVLLGLLGLHLFRSRAPATGRPSQVNWRDASGSTGPARGAGHQRYYALLPGILTALVLFKVAYVDGQTTWFRCQSTADYVCGADTTTQARFSSGVELRGYQMPSKVARAGAPLAVTVFWQADRPIDRPLWSFVHVRNKQKTWPLNPETGSEIWAQQDNVAPAGLPAQDFVPGRLYADELKVDLPRGMPPGEYLLEVGWTDPATGEQLDVEQVQSPLSVLWRSVLLPTIKVR